MPGPIQFLLGAEYGQPFVRVVRHNGAAAKIDPIFVNSGIDNMFTASVNPSALTLSAAVAIDIADGTEVPATITPLGTGPWFRLFEVKVDFNTLTPGHQYLLRVVQGNAACELELWAM